MSTNAAIIWFGKMNENETVGKYNGIYTHWDGYPEHHLPILEKHYMDFEKIKKLISLGSVSVFAEEIEGTPEHNFNNQEDNVTVFYGRDRGDDDVSYVSDASLENLIKYFQSCMGVEYVYIYNYLETKWSYRKLY